MPSWTHLGIGIGLLALLIAGAVNAFPSKGGAAGGGSNIRVRDVEVNGRRYKIIDRGFGTYEVLSPDDPEAWIIFDSCDPGKEATTLASGARGKDVQNDLPNFPPFSTKGCVPS